MPLQRVNSTDITARTINHDRYPPLLHWLLMRITMIIKSLLAA